MTAPVIVPAQEWEAARQRLLVKEKELTRTRDAPAGQRRRMTWLAVEKEYAFDGPAGRVSLLALLDTASNGAVNLAPQQPGEAAAGVAEVRGGLAGRLVSQTPVG
jgi:predicted dithiol-disulfide oxidoreductase (DUF899 family)